MTPARIAFLAGLVVGGVIGFGAAAVCAVAGLEEDE